MDNFEDIFKEIDMFEGFNNLCDLCINYQRKIFYRKYRGIHRKCKRRYIVSRNILMEDFVIPRTHLLTKLLNKRGVL